MYGGWVMVKVMMKEKKEEGRRKIDILFSIQTFLW